MGETFEAAFIFAPKYISNILNEVSLIDDFSMKSARLDFHVQLLENEIRKIDRDELPLCMLLIQDAIERLKEESLNWKEKKIEQVIMEQFMLRKESDDDALEKEGAKRSYDFFEKKNWLSTARLWSTTYEHENPDSGSVKCQQGEGSGTERQVQGSLFRNMGGAFVPFKKPTIGIHNEEKKASAPVVPVQANRPSFTLLVNDVEHVQNNDLNLVRPQFHEAYHNQQQKKQRRCWSSELQRLFIDALNQLGGEKYATPKSIKKIMGIDGLTTDEVKSHFQKYRLHINKQPSSSTGGSSKFSSWHGKAKVGNTSSPSTQ